MKKFISLVVLVFFLISCGKGGELQTESIVSEKSDTSYVVGSRDGNYLNIYGNVVNNNIREVVSHINGQVSSLNCEVGAEVTPGTLIARISPDSADTMYKNNVIQVNSLREQYSNQQSIKGSTLLNFDSQNKQLELQKNDLTTQLKNLENNLDILKTKKDLTGNDLGLQLDSIKSQLSNLEESKKLLEQNKSETLKDIESSIANLKDQIENTGSKSLEKLDETFGVSDENEDENDEFDTFLGAKNSALKNQVESEIRSLLKVKDSGFVNLPDTELSIKIKSLSDTLKNAAEVMDASIENSSTFSKATIDGLYSEFLGYSDAMLTYKTNFDKLTNALSTTSLTFDSELKALDSNLTNLSTQKTTLENNGTKNSDLTFDTNINNLENQIESLKIALKNVDEQIANVSETKNSTIKQLDIQSSQLQDSISKTSVLLSGEDLYAETYGIVKASYVKEGNTLRAGTPICTIVPKQNSLKLEVFSPSKIEIGSVFEYSISGAETSTGTIISESPVRDNLTQNYSYEADIDFSNLREGDYLDIKLITKEESGEVWVPINYVFPKLDGYYVNLEEDTGINVQKVEVGKMNNGEIMIKSGVMYGDVLKP